MSNAYTYHVFFYFSKLQGSVSYAVFATTLRECFPLADDHAMDDLLKSAEEECSGQSVLYKNLFMEDDEGGMGAFANKVLGQDKMERIAYVKEIEMNLEGKRYKLVELVRAVIV